MAMERMIEGTKWTYITSVAAIVAALPAVAAAESRNRKVHVEENVVGKTAVVVVDNVVIS